MARRGVSGGLRRVLSNIAFITGSTFFGRLLNFILYASLGRLFGPEGLGGYSTAVALATYFIFAVDFGLAPRLEREGAVHPERLEEEFAEALGMKLPMAAIALLSLAGVRLILPFDPWIVDLCIFFSIASIVNSFGYLTQAVCRSRERLDLAAISTVLNAVSFVGTSLLLLSSGYGISALGVTSIGAALVQVGSSSFFASRFIRFSVRFPPRWAVAKSALPYATTSLAMLAFAQIDILIMSFIATAEMVGRYAAISRFLVISGTLAALASSAVLPTAARMFSRASRETFDDLINGALRAYVTIGSTIALGLAMVSEPLMGGIYGSDFADLYPLLQAGTLYLVLKFAVSIFAMTLTSTGRQLDRARSVLIGLGSTVILVFVLVPPLGVTGAVIALVASELTLAACLSFFLRERIAWGRLLRTAVCIGVAAAGGLLVHHLSIVNGRTFPHLVSIGLSLLAYLVVLIATGEAMRSIRFFMGLRRGSASR